MSKYADKLSKLTEDINKTVAALDLPIKGVAVVIEWDMDKIPAADANPKELPGGLLAYPNAIALKNVLRVQHNTAAFVCALTEMALNSILEQQNAKPEQPDTP